MRNEPSLRLRVSARPERSLFGSGLSSRPHVAWGPGAEGPVPRARCRGPGARRGPVLRRCVNISPGQETQHFAAGLRTQQIRAEGSLFLRAALRLLRPSRKLPEGPGSGLGAARNRPLRFFFLPSDF